MFEPGQTFQHHAPFGQFIDQRQVLDGAHAVADALDAQVMERVADRLRPAPFAGMGGQAQAGLACHVEGIGEILGLADLLIPGEAEAGEEVARRFRRAARGFARLVGAEMADRR